MVQGLDLLTKVIDMQSVPAFRDVDRAWLQMNEVTMYDFIAGYLQRYSRLPDLSVMNQNGFQLAPESVPQPVEYYFDVVLERYVMLTVQAQIPQLNTALQNRNLTMVREAHINIVRALSAGVTNARDIITFQEAAEEALEQSHRALHTSLLGYTTGWEIMDNFIGGWQRQDVNILVGRPSTGKSYILLKSILENWLRGNSILLTTLEMSGVQMATRLLSMMLGVNPRHFRIGQVSTWKRQEGYQLTIDAANTLPPFHFLIAETRKTLQDVEAVMERYDPSTVYIDAGYLLTTDRSKYIRTRRETIADTIEGMKGLAMRADKPIISTVQFNRNVKTGKKHNEKLNEEMSIEDIGETDTIGQIAYSVTGIHPPPKAGPGRRKRKLQVLKNRDGDLITFNINYLFEPPNFDFIDTVVDEEVEDEAEQTNRREEVAVQRQSLSWM